MGRAERLELNCELTTRLESEMTKTTLILCAAMAVGSLGFYACDNGLAGGSGSAGSCDYINQFSLDPECKEYSGSGWTATSAEASCVAGAVGALPGTWSASSECVLAPTMGTCSVPDPLGLGEEYVLEIGGSDPLDCGTVAGNCAGFLAGTFTPSSICGAP